jgi:hypothetical protein
MACRGTQTVLAAFHLLAQAEGAAKGILKSKPCEVSPQQVNTHIVIQSVAKNPEVSGFRFCALHSQRLFF